MLSPVSPPESSNAILCGARKRPRLDDRFGPSRVPPRSQIILNREKDGDNATGDQQQRMCGTATFAGTKNTTSSARWRSSWNRAKPFAGVSLASPLRLYPGPSRRPAPAGECCRESHMSPPCNLPEPEWEPLDSIPFGAAVRYAGCNGVARARDRRRPICEGAPIVNIADQLGCGLTSSRSSRFDGDNHREKTH
jgi:hypothetical protein